ncbi:dual specificity tyrosine-phosphorylation-regulated kinase mbk-2-like isoform X2 [Anastrepha ludens]|uniref:dual specificity tyrosine-phosphorylation-regulated kinase mbk-2-like isoform X2 n=1 Tax=Anastrepha ludens TaxID=28586 RepID=UPI0023AFFA34|nr:dual specificity tyrosine-phosphorylation-regulated kinase mbk-2-like isoform X2 [Anastrepha ludens]
MPIPQHKSPYNVKNDGTGPKFETHYICTVPTSINENCVSLFSKSGDDNIKNVPTIDSIVSKNNSLSPNTTSEKGKSWNFIKTTLNVSNVPLNNEATAIKCIPTRAAHRRNDDFQEEQIPCTNIATHSLESPLPYQALNCNSNQNLLKTNTRESIEPNNNSYSKSSNSKSGLSSIFYNSSTIHSTISGNKMVGAQKKIQQQPSQSRNYEQNFHNHKRASGHDGQDLLLLDKSAVIESTTNTRASQSTFTATYNRDIHHATEKMSNNVSANVTSDISHTNDACIMHSFTDDNVSMMKICSDDLITTAKLCSEQQAQFVQKYDINRSRCHAQQIPPTMQEYTNADNSENVPLFPITLSANLKILQMQPETENIHSHPHQQHQLTHYNSSNTGIQKLGEPEKNWCSSKSLTALSLARIISTTATASSSTLATPITCALPNKIDMCSSTRLSTTNPDCKIPCILTSAVTATSESDCSVLMSSRTAATECQLEQLPDVGDTFSFHEQIIMSGQEKCALQAKPKSLVVSPQQVMVLYMHKLTPYERTEILAYPQIYFIGANAKKRPGIFGPNNSDYDNDQGAYIHISHDHVAYRYEMLKVIGKGSFGQVIKAYDHKTHEHVALKIVRNEKRFHRQAQEEIRILHHLRRQDKYNTMNIIHMFDYFTFRNHMCITFELLNINLYELIKKNGFKGFSLQLVRKFAHSLLQCLDALYKNEIIHCDMKPENVLLKQQGRSGIKITKMTPTIRNIILEASFAAIRCYA